MAKQASIFLIALLVTISAMSVSAAIDSEFLGDDTPKATLSVASIRTWPDDEIWPPLPDTAARGVALLHVAWCMDPTHPSTYLGDGDELSGDACAMPSPVTPGPTANLTADKIGIFDDELGEYVLLF